MDHAAFGIPVAVVKPPVGIKMFQELHLEARLLQHGAEALVVVENFVVVGSRTRAAGAHPFAIGGIGIKAIRHRESEVSSRLQIGEAGGGCLSAFLGREVFPYMLCKDGLQSVLSEEPFPIIRLEQVQVFDVGLEPAWRRKACAAHHNPQGVTGGNCLLQPPDIAADSDTSSQAVEAEAQSCNQTSQWRRDAFDGAMQQNAESMASEQACRLARS